MSALHLRSATLASALGIALLGAVLAGSTLTIPDEQGQKGNLRLAASDCINGCDKEATRLTHYETAVTVDRDSGMITLERHRIGD